MSLVENELTILNDSEPKDPGKRSAQDLENSEVITKRSKEDLNVLYPTKPGDVPGLKSSQYHEE